ncbi:MAG: hypothetical protein OXG49_07430 [Chloroflexi bacterium]|nr:hypothetical protein [Chloroflexota bacterium]
MNDKDQQEKDIQIQSPSSGNNAVGNTHRAPESPRPRPDPSYGEITEGESGASLWQTIKMALRE